MGRSFCVANQKGGVGKTTTALNLAGGLAKAGCHTLLVDLDPQCNATTGLGRLPVASHPLVAGTPIRQGVVPTGVKGLDLLPGSRSFHDVETLTKDDVAQAAHLREHLTRGFSSYDYVFIDCPPSLGPLTKTTLASSSEVLMPIQCEFFAMEGLTQMIATIGQIMQQAGHALRFGGIVLTMYDHTLELTGEVDHEVRDFFGEIVFRTVIPRDVAVSEAPSHGLTVIDYAPARAARGRTWNFAWRCWIVTKERRLGRGLEALLGQLPGWSGGIPPGQAPSASQPLAGPPATPPSIDSAAPPANPEPVLAAIPLQPPATLQDPSQQAVAGCPASLAAAHSATDTENNSVAASEWKLPVARIEHNPHQPRQDFDADDLQRLADSIVSHGLLQPIVVRPWQGGYQLIAGERRLRAARLAGWTEVPVRIVDADERQTAELAIVENLQRKDLNALEKAASFQRYLDEYGGTQEELAGRLKLDRSTIANLIRLLELPEAVQDALRRGKITQGHARALLPLGDEREQVAFCERVQKEGLNVRQVEALVHEAIAAVRRPSRNRRD